MVIIDTLNLRFRRLSNRVLLVSVVFGFLLSCTSIPQVNIALDDVAGTDLEPNTQESDVKYDPNDVDYLITKLNQSLVNKKDKKITQDFSLMLQARSKEKQGQNNQAVKLWMQAMLKSKYLTCELAFQGYLKSLYKELAPLSLDHFLNIVLKNLKGKKISYIEAQSLNKKDQLKAYLLSLDDKFPVDKLFQDLPQEQVEIDKLDRIYQFQSLGQKINIGNQRDLSDLPILYDSFDRYCSYSVNLDDPMLVTDKHAKIYWKGVQSWCDKQIDASMKAFSYILKTYLDSSKEKKIDPKMALSASLMLVELYKQKGSRLFMSYTWSAIVKIYDTGINYEDLGLDEIKFELQKIDHFLWTSRYLAIAKDYSGAKEIVGRAEGLIKALRQKKLSLQAKQKVDIFEAEAYSVFASRIYIEEKKYKDAINYTLKIKTIKNLPSSWNERVEWNLALYNYLDNNYDTAIQILEMLLSDSKYKSNESRYLYWMSKIYDLKGNSEESQFYLNQLLDKYPFSFYAVYVSYDKKYSHLAEYINYPNSIKSYYLDSSDYNLVLDSQASNLLRRNELAILASLKDYYETTSKEFYSYFKKTYRLSSRTYSDHLFVSKLMAASGSYINTITLITDMVKFDKDFWKSHPEYIFVYYPRPYMDIYSLEAKKVHLKESIPLAVSRQESSFRTSVKSSAGAIGVMQMMPETGIKVYNKLHGSLPKGKDISKMLCDEKYNIELGTYYISSLLKRYRNNIPAAFGGYNAGEYMIDTWLTNRYHSDIITWIEMIPFSETKDYIKNVWRNMMVYDKIFLVKNQEPTLFDLQEF